MPQPFRMTRRRPLVAAVGALALGAASAAIVVTVGASPAGAITKDCVDGSAACPQISGYDGANHPQAGRVVSTTDGAFTGPGTLTYTYRWQLCSPSSLTSSCHDIVNAYNAEYIPTHDTVTSYLRVVVTGHDSGGAVADEASSITPAVDSESPGIGLPGDGGGNTPPSITNTPAPSNPSDYNVRVGDSLSATEATFSSPSATTTVYQWTRCNVSGAACAPIPGVATTASPSSYQVTTADIGSTIRMRARGSNGNGTSELYSAQVGPVAPAADASPSPSANPEGDHTPPQTRFTAKPASTVKTTVSKAGVRFAFAADEASHFQCKLDRGTFKTCTSPLKLAVRATGAGVKHTLKVRAIDKAGNVDPSPSSWTFTAKRVTPPSKGLARNG